MRMIVPKKGEQPMVVILHPIEEVYCVKSVQSVRSNTNATKKQKPTNTQGTQALDLPITERET